jgi:hypothetical protein
MAVEPANESTYSLLFMPICPGAHRKEMENDLILRDSSNARIFRIMGEHLERKKLLTIVKILA